MIEIARALLGEPRILFLDEPTSALAEQEVAWLFELVRGLRDEGECVIFTSHRWREVAESPTGSRSSATASSGDPRSS